jgi:hypothetical protein
MWWVGSMQAGVRLRLRGPEAAWLQPRGPYHYHDLPSTNASLPKFWHNGGKGGVHLTVGDDACVLEAFTGPMIVRAADPPILLHFDLVLTPNKPLDAARKFAELRYYQVESYVPTPRALVQADGVKIVNVHQGNYLNPWIIYPLDPVANAEMRNYSSQCRTHAPPEADVKIKTYYSSGSMSFITECLWAFFALGNEVIAPPNIAVDPIPPPIPPTPLPMIAPPPPLSCANIKNFVDCHPHPGGEASCLKMGCCWQLHHQGAWCFKPAAGPPPLPPVFGAHHWFTEHAGHPSYSSDWTTPLARITNSSVCRGCDMDVSFTTVANSRLANFWSRAIVQVQQETMVDGIYLDGVSYDSVTMLRAMRAISSGKGHAGKSEGMLDLHCGNRYSDKSGEINALEYARHMSLMDSIMMGEGFSDACVTGACAQPDWMLLMTSGIQFGVLSPPRDSDPQELFLEP